MNHKLIGKREQISNVNVNQKPFGIPIHIFIILIDCGYFNQKFANWIQFK